MDRRSFVKAVLTTPLFTPLFSTPRQPRFHNELYLISEVPQQYISFILAELEKYGLASGISFTFVNAHPKMPELQQSLAHRGWGYVSDSSRADLFLSFCPLEKPARASFTLIREGEIWDIRSRQLFTLWKAMQTEHAVSSTLTIASWKQRGFLLQTGDYAVLYKDGQQLERISLNNNSVKSFRGKGGRITLFIREKKAWIGESCCRHKVCEHTPPVAYVGERIICAPNHFLLDIQGPDSPDAVIG
jgi:hypothetical protein